MSYLVREPDALIGPVRFDEREVETGHGREIEAPANERAGYRWTRPKPPRHFSTLLRIGSNMDTSVGVAPTLVSFNDSICHKSHNPSRETLACLIFLIGNPKFHSVRSRLQIRGENHRARIVQASTVMMVQVRFLI